MQTISKPSEVDIRDSSTFPFIILLIDNFLMRGLWPVLTYLRKGLFPQEQLTKASHTS
jgi:hypothetical protein